MRGLNAALVLLSRLSEMTLQEALELHKSGQFDAAEQAYREHLLAEPGDAHALHLLGVLRQPQCGDNDEALGLIRQAIAANSEEAQFHLSLGGALLRAGDGAGARASFERALVLDPNRVQAHGLLGLMSLQSGDVADAESRFRVGRRAVDEDPMILFGLGSIYLERRDAAERARSFFRAPQNWKPERLRHPDQSRLRAV